MRSRTPDHDLPPAPLAAMARRWWLCVLIAIVGLAAGVLVSRTNTTQYTAETRLVVGSQDLSSYEVPGFALASQQLAADYARYVDNGSVATAQVLRGLGAPGVSVKSISASPIAQSNVVSVEVVATNRQTAVRAANNVANSLVRLTHHSTASPAGLLKNFEALSRKATAAQDALDAARKQLADDEKANRSPAASQRAVDRAAVVADSANLQKSTAGTRYQQSFLQKTADSELNVIQAAGIVGDDSTHVAEIAGVIGLAVGLAVAAIVATLLERRSWRRRQRSEARLNAARDARSQHTGAELA